MLKSWPHDRLLPPKIYALPYKGLHKGSWDKTQKHHRTGNDRIACSYSPGKSAIAKKVNFRQILPFETQFA